MAANYYDTKIVRRDFNEIGSVYDPMENQFTSDPDGTPSVQAVYDGWVDEPVDGVYEELVFVAYRRRRFYDPTFYK